MNFKVAFKGQVLALEGWSSDATVGSVKEYLAGETGVEVSGQKLLWKGKVLGDDACLGTLELGVNAKMMLMGTPQQQIDAQHKMDRTAQARAVRRAKAAAQARKSGSSSRSVRDITHTFHRITVLPEFHEQDKARQLLERLRDDKGIVAIMQKHQWSVGELAELSPAQQSILGYNRNKGEQIAIRLRTDDLTGFRHYDSIRKVLLHELSHMVWSEHDDNFHALNRQLNKEVVQLDWTARGRMLQQGAFAPGSMDDEEIDSSAVTWETGSYRLGGRELAPQTYAELRERMARAATWRLTKEEEQEMDEGCGSGSGSSGAAKNEHAT
ncbi:WLM domain-containing protein [Gongronella butleri]|nr:WLM domain-containing protein [Gongronella butleri]